MEFIPAVLWCVTFPLSTKVLSQRIPAGITGGWGPVYYCCWWKRAGRCWRTELVLWRSCPDFLGETSALLWLEHVAAAVAAGYPACPCNRRVTGLRQCHYCTMSQLLWMGTDGDTVGTEIPFLKLHAVARLVNVWRLFKNFSIYVTLYTRVSLLVSQRFLTLKNVNAALEHASYTEIWYNKLQKLKS